MTKTRTINGHISPFEQIRRTTDAGNEYWSNRDFSKVVDCSDYRNFEQVIAKVRTDCFNSGQRIEDHFVVVTDMVEVGKGAKREAKAVEFDRFMYEAGNNSFVLSPGKLITC